MVWGSDLIVSGLKIIKIKIKIFAPFSIRNLFLKKKKGFALINTKYKRLNVNLLKKSNKLSCDRWRSWSSRVGETGKTRFEVGKKSGAEADGFGDDGGGGY